MYCIWSWNRPLNSALVTALFVITPVFMLNSGYIWNKTETKQFHWNKTVFCVCFVSVTFQYYFSSNHGFTRDAILNLTSRAAFISLRLLSSYQWCLSWRNLKNVADERLFFSHVPYTEKRTHIRCKFTDKNLSLSTFCWPLLLRASEVCNISEVFELLLARHRIRSRRGHNTDDTRPTSQS